MSLPWLASGLNPEPLSQYWHANPQAASSPRSSALPTRAPSFSGRERVRLLRRIRLRLVRAKPQHRLSQPGSQGTYHGHELDQRTALEGITLVKPLCGAACGSLASLLRMCAAVPMMSSAHAPLEIRCISLGQHKE